MKNFKSIFTRVTCATVAAASIMTSVKAAAAELPNYCVAIRGNGELVPSHWGAMAQTIENFGAISAMAGGSSGSMTTFLWESMMANPMIKAMTKEDQAAALALLFKSFEGIVEIELQQKDWQSLIQFIKLSQTGEGKKKLTDILASLANPADAQNASAQLSQVQQAIMKLKDTGLFFGPAAKKLAASAAEAQQNPSPEKMQNILAQSKDLQKSISQFGSFDAKNDTQLFIRDGLIDFPSLANAIGLLADALSLRNASEGSTNALNSFITNCAASTKGLNWSDIKSSTKTSTKCEAHMKSWIMSYGGTYKQQPNSRLNDRIGDMAPAIVSTSIVQGQASVNQFLQIKADYDKNHDPSLGGSMSIPSDNLRFGYWSTAANLKDIDQNLVRDIDKSKRFLALGSETWKTILSLSPAEPGLSAFLPFTSAASGENLISIGGWSDLHPIPVLKALGCKNVVYVTRRGGDSIFGMGVAKRILGLDKPDWNLLASTASDPAAKDSNLHNMLGDSAPMDTQWAAMFSLKNPASSFSKSLSLADAVVCTDWNSFNIRKDFHPMIQQAYVSEIYMPQGSSLKPAMSKNIIQADSIQKMSPENYPVFAGCIPQ